MHPRLSELLGFLDQQRREVLRASSALPRDQWGIRPGPDRWSISEICWHLQKVERGIARLISGQAVQAREAGHADETSESSVLGSLDGRPIPDRRSGLAAPVPLIPTEIPDAESVLLQLDESRGMMRAAVANADGLALETLTWKHPVLGEIDLYQWILFVGHHEARHVEQITETTAAVSTARNQPMSP